MQKQKSKRFLIKRSRLALFFTDLTSLAISFFLAITLRGWLNQLINTPLEPIKGFWPLIALNVFLILVILAFMGLYKGYGIVAVVELRKLTVSIFISYIIFAFSAYLIGQGARLSRLVFIFSLLFCLILVPLSRFVIYNRFSKYKSWGENVVLIGSMDQLIDINNSLQKSKRLGFNPIAFLSTSDAKENLASLNGFPVDIFSIDRCKELTAAGINFAFYTSTEVSQNDPILNEICQLFPTVYFVLPGSSLSSLWVEVTDLLGRPTLKVRYYLLIDFYNHLKRIIEVAIVLLFSIISLPITALLAFLVYQEDGGPVFFKQDRVGKNGKIFGLMKFRTMVPNAESILASYLAANPKANEEYLEFHKLEKDPRVTKIGKFLRKFSLDEIPQCINVIKGDMNLVGPRAYMPHELDLSDETTQTILRVRPGMTGWWQVMGRNEATFSDRKKLDMYYITNWSIWIDYYILLKTGWVILSGQGK